MVILEKQNKTSNDKLYKNTLKKLHTLIEVNVPIDHVGSTVLPRMYGKNIIDILIGAKTNEEMDVLSNKIIELGFFSGSKKSGYIYRFFASTDEETKAGDIHIHLAKVDSDRYKDFLILKKYLLKNKKDVNVNLFCRFLVKSFVGFW